jgi:hypothetical protein
VDRHRILDGIRDVRHILEEKDGVWVLTDKNVEEKLRQYFISRDDDGV